MSHTVYWLYGCFTTGFEISWLKTFKTALIMHILLVHTSWGQIMLHVFTRFRHLTAFDMKSNKSRSDKTDSVVKAATIFARSKRPNSRISNFAVAPPTPGFHTLHQSEWSNQVQKNKCWSLRLAWRRTSVWSATCRHLQRRWATRRETASQRRLRRRTPSPPPPPSPCPQPRRRAAATRCPPRHQSCRPRGSWRAATPGRSWSADQGRCRRRYSRRQRTSSSWAATITLEPTLPCSLRVLRPGHSPRGCRYRASLSHRQWNTAVDRTGTKISVLCVFPCFSNLCSSTDRTLFSPVLVDKRPFVRSLTSYQPEEKTCNDKHMQLHECVGGWSNPNKGPGLNHTGTVYQTGCVIVCIKRNDA